jgi:threonine/homoserine/homoserine lactone efflux protein
VRAAPTKFWWQQWLLGLAFALAGNAFFPRLSHRARWSQRFGVRGELAYAIAKTLFAVTFAWFALKMAQRREEMFEEVRADLGREPTADEVFEHFRAKAE